MMKIPSDKELFETPVSTLWFDENGILCNVTKKTTWSNERYDEVLKVYERLTKNGEKLCILSDISNTKDLDSGIREYIQAKAPQYIKASAVMSESALKASLTNILMKLNMNSFPVRMFTSEVSAKKWLKGYL